MIRSYSQLVNEVRNLLGFESTGTRETIACNVSDDVIERERVRNIVDDMIADGGLRRYLKTNFYYQPRPARECDDC